MKRVMIIGCPGSGKSTLSRKLSNLTQLPLYHLDLLNWNSDGTVVDKVVFDERLLNTINKHEWIIDGNYGATLELRFNACDTVIFLDYPLEVCLEGVKNRQGKYRSDMPFVETQEDDTLLQFIHAFALNHRPKIINLLNKYSDKQIYQFNSRIEADLFLVSLKQRLIDYQVQQDE